MVTLAPSLCGEKRSFARVSQFIREAIAVSRVAPTAEAAETELFARAIAAELVEDVDGLLTDGHRDEVNDLLADLVRVEWLTKRLDAKRDWHYTALEKSALTIDCTATPADWQPEELEIWAVVTGHPGGKGCGGLETVRCTPGAVFTDNGRRLVRYQLAKVAE